MSALSSAVGRFALFWYRFLVGEDWTIAVGVVAAIGVSYGLVEADADACWLVLPLGAVGILAVSVRRANRGIAGRT